MQRLVRWLGVGFRGRALGAALIAGVLASGVPWAPALAAPSGAADDAPENQKESDWVDSRWSRTDFGNFQASVLPLPNGAVAKGFSVRVGDEGQAALVYDTASLTLRAGWTGAFLEFSGARYGLIQPPRPAGRLRYVAPAAPAWGEATARWRGFHVHGPRVVLDYDVGNTAIQESPWYEGEAARGAFTRTLAFGRRTGPLTLTLLDAQGRHSAIEQLEGVRLATLTNKDGLLAVATTGDATAQLRWSQGALQLHLPAADAPGRVKVFLMARGSGDLAPLAALVKKSPPPEDLSVLARPGPPRWHELTTRGQRALGADALLIDTLSIPYDNPWQALFFTSGVDFLPNGDAAVCTLHGDVWLVSGIDDKLARLTWKRFATGLFQPLGLRVRDGRIFVLGRDRITRLHDSNGDGEADDYESFFDGIHTSTGGHEYVTSLETDTNGNFYYVDPRGLHRVSADGARLETIAAGWRNPNGLGASPDGSILTVAPQEGEWTPSSAICEVRPGGWYGYGGPKVTPERPLGYDAPLCWIPHRVDNSGGSQLWVSSPRWGPLAGHFLHFSFGRCAQFLVLRDPGEGVSQGAVVPLPGRFLSGAMRGAFHPQDGQLYVVGSRGWQTSAVRDGCLQRVRYTGKDPLVPVAFQVHSNGLLLTFSTALERAAAQDPGSYAVSQWNYRYAAQYGSKDYSVMAPDREGHDALDVAAATLLPDGRSVFLEIPTLRPVMQWEVKYNLASAEGKAMRSQLHGTINRMAPSWHPPAASRP